MQYIIMETQHSNSIDSAEQVTNKMTT